MSSKKATSQNEDGQISLVPKLRFPEFQSEGEWTTETLGFLVTVSTEKVGSNTCIPMSITSGVGLVSQQEKFGRIIAGSSYKNYLLLKQNDFAYNKSATKEYPEGFIALYTGGELAAVPNSIFTCFRIKGTSPAHQYLNYLFLSNFHGKWLRKFIEVGARAHGSLSINEKDLLALPVPLPNGKNSVSEQKKIAECLSSVGELIATQARKLDALKTYKKGLMQQLFPREGETQPRLRFPEFQTPWKAGVIEQLASTVMGNAFRSTDFVESGTQVIRIGNLYQGELQLDRAPVYLSDLQTKENSRFIVNPLDLLMSMTGTVGKRDYGFVIQVPAGCQPLLLNQRVMKIAPKHNCNAGFLLQLLKDERLLDQLYSLPGGTKQANLSAQNVKELKISYPHEFEQQRIADCLSTLDDLIAAQTQKLEALKTHKKGLKQQLFPATEEVEL